MNFLKAMFGNYSKREVKRVQPICDKVLALDRTTVPESTKADADEDFANEVEELIAQRTKARAEKDWATADAIRDKLKEMKVVVKDTKDGIEWHVEG